MKIENLHAKLRAAWRTMYASLVGVTTRVKNKLTARMQKHTAR
jgi:hypothetical protein